MNHQEEFLYNFFSHISQLCFDKAKESIEKEKESCKLTQMGPWGMLLTYLPQVIMIEKSYCDLGFLQTKNKSFLRKDNSLKSIYESLKADFKKLEEVTRGFSSLETLVSEVSSQLCSFITARINLIDFYEKMYNMSTTSKTMRFGELLQTIENIAKDESVLCSHPTFTSVKATLISECDILLQLTKAQIYVEKWQFLPSLGALYDAQTRMTAWEKTLQVKESWKLGFLKSNQSPALYQWLTKLRSAILSKFSLYFHTTLSQQANTGEMRNYLSKQSVDYYHKMQNFQRKYDALAIVIAFDSKSSQDCGPSYRHPKREIDTTERFNFVVSCPNIFIQKPSVHWQTIKQWIEALQNDLNSSDKVIHKFCKVDFTIYMFLNIDLNTTLVVVYECGKVKNNESYINTFMADLCAQLRCNKVYESLKLPK